VRLAQLVPTAVFWITVGFSLARIAAGFAVAFVLGLALGLAAHRWPALAELLAPAVSFLKSVPIVCVIVLLLMWVGSARVSAIAVFLAVFPAIYFSVLEGCTAASPGLGELLRVMGVPGWRRFLADTWQQLLPYLVATCRNACGMAWKAGVAAELIGSPRGSMGERIYQAKLLLETGDLFAWTIVVVALSWACEKAFLALLRATGGWALSASVPRPVADRRQQPAAAAISLDQVTLGYDGEPVATCNLELAPGSRTVLSDPSGAGKTTLVRTACGLLAPLSGYVEAPAWGELSVQFQDTRLVEAMTAEQNLLLCSAGTLSAGEAHALLAELLPEDALGRAGLRAIRRAAPPRGAGASARASGCGGCSRRALRLARCRLAQGGGRLCGEPPLRTHAARCLPCPWRRGASRRAAGAAGIKRAARGVGDILGRIILARIIKDFRRDAPTSSMPPAR
jgi:NitT/TauT family transport system permease protein